jgi:hypothetical protein
MVKPREKLQELLADILGSNQVYFQPPETVKMKYPAIVYELNKTDTIHANNQAYHFVRSYTITFITYDSNPDSEVNRKLLNLPMCSFDRHYMADNLHHYVYNLFF